MEASCIAFCRRLLAAKVHDLRILRLSLALASIYLTVKAVVRGKLWKMYDSGKIYCKDGQTVFGPVFDSVCRVITPLLFDKLYRYLCIYLAVRNLFSLLIEPTLFCLSAAAKPLMDEAL